MAKFDKDKWMVDMQQMAAQFNIDLLGYPVPEVPAMLSDKRKDWATTVLTEELSEFLKADNLADQADALIDLAYFAFGRIIEMGLAPRPLFEEVHAANMRKVRGERSKRTGSAGYDAAKPEGWVGPDLMPYLALTRQDLIDLGAAMDLDDDDHILPFDDELVEAEVPEYLPKVVILGHAQHGKDAAAEFLESHYGLENVSASRIAAEKIILPALQDPRSPDLKAQYDKLSAPVMPFNELVEKLIDMVHKNYADAEACYQDRGQHRAVWFTLIAMYCADDGAALAREVFSAGDVYCGIRSRKELQATINSGLCDLVIWVDASERKLPEPLSSCQVEPWMAGYQIDNNGSLEQLHYNLKTLMETLGYGPRFNV